MSDSEPDKTSQPILGPDSKQAAALEAVHTLAMNLQVRACVCIHVCVHTCAIKPLNEAVHTLAMHLQVCVLCVCVLCVYLCVCTYMCN